MPILSKRVAAAEAAAAPTKDFYFSSRYGEHRGDAGIADFTFGNPQEMPLSGLVGAIHTAAIPKDKSWYAYKTNEAEPQAFLAEVLSRELNLPFEPNDIAITAGAFGAIAIACRLLLDAGDEAIVSEPAWFCYEPTLLLADAVPRKVSLTGDRFDLDLDAIDSAIGPRTRLVIVNTPHNPTGRIYDRDALTALADLLDRASARIGRRIFLLSDEPYRRLRFDGRGFTSPAAVYPWTLIDYSFGKVLLAPGQRLGYLALSPLMPRPDRETLTGAFFAAQMSMGWAFASAIMQHALPDLEHLSIDMDALTRKRDRVATALRTGGAAVLQPEGTFYLWSRWPAGEPDAHWNHLADRGVFVMPGSIMGVPEWFRMCLTASEEMVERAVPVLESMS